MLALSERVVNDPNLTDAEKLRLLENALVQQQKLKQTQIKLDKEIGDYLHRTEAARIMNCVTACMWEVLHSNLPHDQACDIVDNFNRQLPLFLENQQQKYLGVSHERSNAP